MKSLLLPILLAFGQYPVEKPTLPKTYDAFLGGVLRNATFYKLKPVFQHKEGLRPVAFQEEFNGNLDFPWETTFGLNAANRRKDNPHGTTNFLYLPEGKKILVIPDSPVRWIFPEGAVVGEIIYVTYKQKRHIQEIRTRLKVEGSLNWEPGIYRPLANRSEFIYWAGLLDYRPAKKFLHLRNPEEDQVALFEGFVERLPTLPPASIEKLLSLPFKNVTREKWSDISSAPSADSDFHIVPKDYSLGLLDVSTGRCMACHRQTQIKISSLIPNEPLIRNNPDKVGSIRGCDGVFTWHPFAEDKVPARVLRSNDQSFVVFESSMCDDDGNVAINGEKYLLTRDVEEALKGAELPPVLFRHKRPSAAQLMQYQVEQLQSLIKKQNEPKARYIWDEATKSNWRTLDHDELNNASAKGLTYHESGIWQDLEGFWWNYDAEGRYWWRTQDGREYRR